MRAFMIVIAFAFLMPAMAHASQACMSAPSPMPGIKDVLVDDVCHKGYLAEVDDKAKVPRIVAYVLTGPHTLGCNVRVSDFHRDPALPKGSAAPSDYAKSGYDKGHQAPAEDFAWNQTEEFDSFSMANMAPQKPGLNRQEWERLEATVRAWALTAGPLNVYTGPILGGHGAIHKTIGKDRVAVPTAFWKVVTGKLGTLAFLMPNKAIKKGDLTPYMVDTATVEKQAGIAGFKTSSTTLWSADLSGWERAHKQACKK